MVSVGLGGAKANGSSVTLAEQSCIIVRPNTVYSVERPLGTVGMVVKQDPNGNKPAPVK